MAKPRLTTKGKLLRCFSRIRNKTPTLTVWGFNICCKNEENDAVEQRFDWGNALIDAGITSGITFFSTLGGTAVAGDVSAIHILGSATIAAFSQFFIFVALKRGLVKTGENKPQ